jgi:hypothetical protein
LQYFIVGLETASLISRGLIQNGLGISQILGHGAENKRSDGGEAFVDYSA